MQLVQLRFRAVCAVCSSKLPPRAEAWQDEQGGRTVCLSCHRIEEQAQAAAAAAEYARSRQPVPDLNRAPRLVPVRPGEREDEATGPEAVRRELEAEIEQAILDQERLAAERAAAEAREAAQRADRERQQRGQARGKGLSLPRPKRTEAGVQFLVEPLSAAPPGSAPDVPGGRRTKLPLVGPSLAAGVEVAKQIGAEAADNAIARALEAARPHGLEIIKSRPWTGTRVESEAIVVAPSGVWVVDGLDTAGGPVEKGFLSGHAGAELLNVVGGRTSIISGLLFDSPYQSVPVRGALCFDSGVPSWFDGPFALAGITITTPRELVDSLFTPLHLDAETRRKVAQHLVNRF